MIIDNLYKDLLRKILKEGKIRKNRTGIDAITIPHGYIEYDMSNGFPLLTLRQLGIRSIAAELEGFLRGATDKRWYQDRKCTIWDEWANPKAVAYRLIQWQEAHNQDYLLFKDCVAESAKLEKQFQKEERDLGTFYAWQWRNFNGEYKYPHNPDNIDIQELATYKYCGDQLINVLKKIQENPNDRRMICSAWNVLQIETAALPSCHTEWKVNCLDDKINLSFKMRSWDYILGAPYNISSYAILLLLLGRFSGLQPGKLSVFGDDIHVYKNHLDGCEEILSRKPYKSPTLDIAHLKPFELDGYKLKINWTYKDLALLDYKCHDKINFEVAI